MSETRQLYFGKFPIDERQVFYETKNIIGIVNISPILHDHVLVIPISTSAMGAPQKFYDMTPELVSELYLAVHTIQTAIKDNRGIADFNIAMQDGKSAGQSVPHVHVHILPRKGGEFTPPDKVHSAIQDAKMGPDGDNSSAADSIRIPRRDGKDGRPGMEQMAKEAIEYREWFGTVKTGGRNPGNMEQIKDAYTQKLIKDLKKHSKKGGKKTRKRRNNKKKGKRTRSSNRK
jgi:bis(5'-adenosyl)-triphosphatase